MGGEGEEQAGDEAGDPPPPRLREDGWGHGKWQMADRKDYGLMVLRPVAVEAEFT